MGCDGTGVKVFSTGLRSAVDKEKRNLAAAVEVVPLHVQLCDLIKNS